MEILTRDQYLKDAHDHHHLATDANGTTNLRIGDGCMHHDGSGADWIGLPCCDVGMMTDIHVPVLAGRVRDLFEPVLSNPGAIFVDATVGLGGHSAMLLNAFPDSRVIGLDRDPAALGIAAERLLPFGDRVQLVHAIYDELTQVLSDRGIPAVDGVLFDLGVSSMQLDREDRGFSYAQDAVLDMRMDPTAGLTAADVLNTYDQASLARILREYGEERFASRIAKRIVQERVIAPFTTSARLVDIIRESIPAATRRTGGNPAKRTFQALRIEVNGELDALRHALPQALDALAPHGRIVVMSYQSLEDRIVKRALAAEAHPDVPRGLPVVPAHAQPRLRLLTRGAEKASDQEILDNPRATPARLRAAERLAVAA
jgi:16S rRNA (cytosine1402-N4)-methyltransferase